MERRINDYRIVVIVGSGLLIGQLAVTLLTRGWGFDPAPTLVVINGLDVFVPCHHTCSPALPVFMKWSLIGMAGVLALYVARGVWFSKKPS